jgi:hypothetical protein
MRSIANAYHCWNYLYVCHSFTSNSVVHLMAHYSEIIETRGHHLVGVRWEVIGSKGDKYHVEMVNYGFECDCIAFRKCKHIKTVEKKITDECIF